MVGRKALRYFKQDQVFSVLTSQRLVHPENSNKVEKGCFQEEALLQTQLHLVVDEAAHRRELAQPGCVDLSTAFLGSAPLFTGARSDKPAQRTGTASRQALTSLM